MSIVSDVITTHLPGKRKQTSNGWTSFDAPCCHHNGESRDTKLRGGLISEGDAVSFHCFNCGFKASWQPGRNVSNNLRKFLLWLNVSDNEITKLTFDVMRINEGVEIKKHSIVVPTFNTVALPLDAVKITDITEFNKFSMAVVEYMASRSLDLSDTTYYYSSQLRYRDRLIIPFYYEGNVVGSTSRTCVPNKNPKYLNDTQAGFVYGLDDQVYGREFVIVCEGPVDAIYVGGCALSGSEISAQQALLLNRLQRQVVIVPDRDKAGSKLVEQAIELGWSVSMPEWDTDLCDIGEVVERYCRLYALYSIADTILESPLKIRLRAKKWFK